MSTKLDRKLDMTPLKVYAHKPSEKFTFAAFALTRGRSDFCQLIS